ncbi:MAG: ribosomal RNA small subunit methyltransferase A [Clostridia bacterium]|nr:ribosomal RNA small subunit methyltransferase A [Clostridia bacterium]
MAEYRHPSAELRARVALEKHGFRNAHSLGQNFILDEGLLEHLLDAAEVWGEDNVLEIGPGPGLMTALLAARAKRVTAVEIDRGLEPVLREVLNGADNVRLVFQDILKADLPALVREAFGDEPYRVVANLPYYITADIVLRLVTSAKQPGSIAIMVQREAADRVMSHPGEKQWCALAATVQSYGQPRVLMDVGPDVFDPPPHVQSQFIMIARHGQPLVEPKDEKTYLKLISAAFAMRRKTLANNLKASFGLDNDGARAVLRAADVDERVRGEALTLQELCRVADAIMERM